MKIAIVSLFPEMFEPLTQLGVVGRAFQDGAASLQCFNPRDYTEDKHQTVDDRPYGGGPGMVMLAEPLKLAVNDAKQQLPNAQVVLLSPQGKVLNQQAVNEFAQRDEIIFVAGRYEGVDERFIQSCVDEEWSIGNYVLCGGELAAAVVIDSCIRLLPGVLGHDESAVQDSFSGRDANLLDCPHYTRPETWNGLAVPDVLLSGDHRKIESWRKQQMIARTSERRPDLLAESDLQIKPKG